MKKYVLLILFGIILLPFNIYAEELIPNAKSGLLMEESTGNIIFEKAKDEKVAVASMTKMVAQIIIIENIEQGKIKWDDIVTVSKNAADMGGSQIYLAEGEKMSVKDIFKGISMASANDGTVALAEYISGSEEKFVKLMNKKVKDLGLKNTVFKNSTGLDEEGHYSTAYDMAIIARELLQHKEILKFSSVNEDYLRVNTPNKFWLVNTNRLVRLYQGVDGLKTGHTDNAGYCIAVTAKKNNMRLIGIVLGEKEAKVRNSEASSMLDYGFNTKRVQNIKKRTDIIKKVTINKANIRTINIYSKYDINILKDVNANNIKYSIKTNINDLKLPLNKNDKVGTIKVLNKNNIIYEGDLIVKQKVKKLSFLQIFLSNIKEIAVGKV